LAQDQKTKNQFRRALGHEKFRNRSDIKESPYLIFSIIYRIRIWSGLSIFSRDRYSSDTMTM